MYTKNVIYFPYDWGLRGGAKYIVSCRYDERVSCTPTDEVDTFVALALAWRPGMQFPHNTDCPRKCMLNPRGCPRYLAAQKQR